MVFPQSVKSLIVNVIKAKQTLNIQNNYKDLRILNLFQIINFHLRISGKKNTHKISTRARLLTRSSTSSILYYLNF